MKMSARIPAFNLTVIAFALLAVSCSRSGRLDGQVFIATKGGQNIKLGQVEVMILPVDGMLPWIKRKRAFAESESSRLKGSKNIEDMRAFLRLYKADYWFEDFPKPMVTTVTDADGKFSATIPTQGKFCVAARAQRSVGDEEEKYAWILQVSLEGASEKTILLSNNNQTSSFSGDTLIPTE